jgi:hypothetical protein
MSTLRTNALEGVDAKNSITIVAGAGNITTTNVQEGLAKAWVNFNGEGTIATRASLNVASLTDNGTGNHEYNLTNNMSSANYARLVSAGDSGNRRVADTGAATSNTTSKGTVIHQNISDASLADGGDNNGAMLGDLA